MTSRSGDRPRVDRVPTVALLGAFRVDEPDALHEQLRSARDGDDDARREVLRALRGAAHTPWPRLTTAVVIPVPGHHTGGASPWVLEVATELAAARGWSLESSSLLRTTDVVPARSGERRDASAELASLAWSDPGHAGAIVLVDDVVRTGGTLRACARLILQARPRSIVAVALAEAVGDPSPD